MCYHTVLPSMCYTKLVSQLRYTLKKSNVKYLRIDKVIIIKKFHNRRLCSRLIWSFSGVMTRALQASPSLFLSDGSRCASQQTQSAMWAPTPDYPGPHSIAFPPKSPAISTPLPPKRTDPAAPRFVSSLSGGPGPPRSERSRAVLPRKIPARYKKCARAQRQGLVIFFARIPNAAASFSSLPPAAPDAPRRNPSDLPARRRRDLVAVGILVAAATVFWPGGHGGGRSREAVELGLGWRHHRRCHHGGEVRRSVQGTSPRLLWIS
jgi:hypothetical protein